MNAKAGAPVRPTITQGVDQQSYTCPACDFTIHRKRSEPKPRQCPNKECRVEFIYATSNAHAS